MSLVAGRCGRAAFPLRRAAGVPFKVVPAGATTVNASPPPVPKRSTVSREPTADGTVIVRVPSWQYALVLRQLTTFLVTCSNACLYVLRREHPFSRQYRPTVHYRLFHLPRSEKNAKRFCLRVNSSTNILLLRQRFTWHCCYYYYYFFIFTDKCVNRFRACAYYIVGTSNNIPRRHSSDRLGRCNRAIFIIIREYLASLIRIDHLLRSI